MATDGELQRHFTIEARLREELSLAKRQMSDMMNAVAIQQEQVAALQRENNNLSWAMQAQAQAEALNEARELCASLRASADEAEASKDAALKQLRELEAIVAAEHSQQTKTTATLQQQLEQAQKLNKSLQSQLDDVKRDYEGANEEIEGLIDQVAAAQSQADAAKRTAATAEVVLARKQAELEAANTAVRKAAEAEAAAEKRAHAAEALVADLQDSVQRLERQVESMHAKFQQQEDESGHASVRIAMLEQELSDMQSNTSQVTTLQEQMQAADEQRRTLQASIHALETHLQESHNETLHVQQQLHDSEVRVRTLLQQVADLEAALHTAQGREGELQQQLDAQHTAAEAAAAKLHLLQSSFAELQAGKEQSDAAAQALQQQLESQEQSFQQRLGVERTNSAAALADVETELEEAREAQNTLQLQLDAAAAQAQDANRELERLQAELQQLQTSFAEAQGSVDRASRLDQTVQQLTEQLAAAQQQHQEQTAKLESLNEEVGSLRTQLTAAQETELQLRGEADSAAELRALVTESKQLEAELQAQVQQLQQAATDVQHAHATQVALLTDQVTQLQSQVAQSHQEIESCKSAERSLESQIHQLQASLDSAQCSGSQAVMDLTEQINALSTQLSQTQAVETDLRSQLEAAQQAQVDAANAQEQLEELQTLNEQLQLDVQSATDRLAKAEQHIHALQHEMQQRELHAQAAAQAALDSLRAQLLHEGQQLIAERTQQLEGAHAEIQRLQEQNTHLTGEVAERVAFIEKIKVRFHAQKQSLSEKEEELSRVKTQLAEAAAASGSLDSLTAQLQEAQDRENDLRAQLEAANAAVQTKSSEASALAAAAQELQQRVAAVEQLQASRDQVVGERDALKAYHEKAVAAWNIRENELVHAHDAQAAELESLQAQLHEARAKLEETEQKLKDVQDELDLANETLQSQPAESQSAMEVEALRTQLHGAQAALADSRAHVDAHAAEIETLRSQLHDAQSSLEEKEQQLKDVQDELDLANETLQSQPAESQSVVEVETLRAQLQGAQAALADSEQRLIEADEALRSQAVALEAANVRHDADLHKLRAEVEGLSTKLHTALTDLADREQQLKDLQGELELANAALEAQPLTSDTAAEVETLRAQLQASQAALADSEQRLKDVQDELDLANAALESQPAKADSTAEVETMRMQLRALHAQLADTEQQLSEASAARQSQSAEQEAAQAQHDAKLRSAHDEAEGLQSRLRVALADLADREQRLTDLQDELDLANAALQAQPAESQSTAEVETLRAQLHAAQTALADAEQRLTDLQDELDLANAALESQPAKPDSTAEVETLRMQLRAVHTQLTDSEQRIRALEDEVELANNTLQSQSAELDAAHAQHERAVATWRAQEAELQAQASAAVEEMKQQLQTAQAIAEEAAQRLRDASPAASAAHAEVETLRLQLRAAQTSAEEAEQKLKDVQGELDLANMTLQSQPTELEALKAEHDKAIAAWRLRETELIQALAGRHTEIDTLRTQLDAAQTAAKDAEQQLKDVQDELDLANMTLQAQPTEPVQDAHSSSAAEVTTLKVQLVAMQNSVKDTEDRLKATQDELDQARTVLQSHPVEFEKATQAWRLRESELLSRLADSDNALERVAELEAAGIRARVRINELEAQVVQLHASLTLGDQKLQAMEARAIHAETQLFDKDTAVTEVRSALDQSHKQIGALQTQLKEFRKRAESESSRFSDARHSARETALAEAAEELAAVQEQLEHEKQQHEESMRLLTEAQAQARLVPQLQREVQDLSARVQQPEGTPPSEESSNNNIDEWKVKFQTATAEWAAKEQELAARIAALQQFKSQARAEFQRQATANNQRQASLVEKAEQAVTRMRKYRMGEAIASLSFEDELGHHVITFQQLQAARAIIASLQEKVVNAETQAADASLEMLTARQDAADARATLAKFAAQGSLSSPGTPNGHVDGHSYDQDTIVKLQNQWHATLSSLQIAENAVLTYRQQFEEEQTAHEATKSQVRNLQNLLNEAQSTAHHGLMQTEAERLKLRLLLDESKLDIAKQAAEISTLRQHIAELERDAARVRSSPWTSTRRDVAMTALPPPLPPAVDEALAPKALLFEDVPVDVPGEPESVSEHVPAAESVPDARVSAVLVSAADSVPAALVGPADSVPAALVGPADSVPAALVGSADSVPAALVEPGSVPVAEIVSTADSAESAHDAEPAPTAVAAEAHMEPEVMLPASGEPQQQHAESTGAEPTEPAPMAMRLVWTGSSYAYVMAPAPEQVVSHVPSLDLTVASSYVGTHTANGTSVAPADEPPMPVPPAFPSEAPAMTAHAAISPVSNGPRTLAKRVGSALKPGSARPTIVPPQQSPTNDVESGSDSESYTDSTSSSGASSDSETYSEAEAHPETPVEAVGYKVGARASVPPPPPPPLAVDNVVPTVSTPARPTTSYAAPAQGSASAPASPAATTTTTTENEGILSGFLGLFKRRKSKPTIADLGNPLSLHFDETLQRWVRSDGSLPVDDSAPSAPPVVAAEAAPAPAAAVSAATSAATVSKYVDVLTGQPFQRVIPAGSRVLAPISPNGNGVAPQIAVFHPTVSKSSDDDADGAPKDHEQHEHDHEHEHSSLVRDPPHSGSFRQRRLERAAAERQKTLERVKRLQTHGSWSSPDVLAKHRSQSTDEPPSPPKLPAIVDEPVVDGEAQVVSQDAPPAPAPAPAPVSVPASVAAAYTGPPIDGHAYAQWNAYAVDPSGYQQYQAYQYGWTAETWAAYHASMTAAAAGTGTSGIQVLEELHRSDTASSDAWNVVPAVGPAVNATALESPHAQTVAPVGGAVEADSPIGTSSAWGSTSVAPAAMQVTSVAAEPAVLSPVHGSEAPHAVAPVEAEWAVSQPATSQRTPARGANTSQYYTPARRDLSLLAIDSTSPLAGIAEHVAQWTGTHDTEAALARVWQALHERAQSGTQSASDADYRAILQALQDAQAEKARLLSERCSADDITRLSVIVVQHSAAIRERLIKLLSEALQQPRDASDLVLSAHATEAELALLASQDAASRVAALQSIIADATHTFQAGILVVEREVGEQHALVQRLEKLVASESASARALQSQLSTFSSSPTAATVAADMTPTRLNRVGHTSHGTPLLPFDVQ